MVEVMRIMATSFKRSHAHITTFSVPNTAAGHRQPTPPQETPGHSRASLGQCLLGSWCTQLLFVFSNSLFPQSCVSSGGSMVGLMVTSSKRAYAIPTSAAPSHTQICCTQSPCPCGRPLLTCTSAEDTQTQFWLSLCGVSGSWCTQGLLEPSKCL